MLSKLRQRGKKSLSRGARGRARADGGRLMKIAPHPPDFISAPWYNLVVRIEDPPQNFTTADLFNALTSQLNISFELNASVRLQQVRVWGALVPFQSTNPLQPIQMAVFDPLVTLAPNSATSRVLEQLTDYPDLVSRACIGYHYPKAQREVALLIQPAQALALVTFSGMGAGSIVYFNVQWRPNNTVPITQAMVQSFEPSSDSEVEVISVRGTKKPSKRT